ncbi:protoporphyrinogen/coproporphyrinogen oxidase [Desulfuribacillus alkaliarsenatis]|uniref:Amine oxidase domain-containing protein n=1 Tax=Desulfuribacillus alkaliarsenatis TaxID=766136 RepID=A0A1E5G4U2_9FIRM|nr:FAD-dependent oxidoreductase [Desulfuribacillus alkaliarsenatis]OEF98198.1 hypothetical protein BHF68_00475 [Desulfuribacillus alkaliarsenatis]
METHIGKSATNGIEGSDYDIIVVGAGISGLTVAYEVQKQGHKVLVLEANSRVGGRIYTEQVDDFTYEVGAQFLGGFYNETFRLIKELGIEKDLERFHNAMFIQMKGVFQLADQESPWHLMLPPGLKIRDRIKLKNLMFDTLKNWSKISHQDIEKSAGIDNLTMEEYAFKRLNPHILRSFISPMISSLYFMSTAEASYPLFMTMLKNVLSFHLYTFRGGLKKLPEALAKKLNVKLEQKAEQLIRTQYGWTVVTSNRQNYQELWSAKKVIVAIPSMQALELFPKALDLTLEQTIFLEKQKYTQTTSLITGYNHRIRPGAYSFIVPPTETSGVSSITLEHEKFRKHVPEPYGLHTLYTHTHFTEKLSAYNKREKKVMILKEAEKLITRYREHVTWSKLYDVPIGLPHPYVNKAQEVKDFQFKQQQNINKGLLFCGDYLNWPSIEGSVAVAKKTAKMLKQQ